MKRLENTDNCKLVARDMECRMVSWATGTETFNRSIADSDAGWADLVDSRWVAFLAREGERDDSVGAVRRLAHKGGRNSRRHATPLDVRR